MHRYILYALIAVCLFIAGAACPTWAADPRTELRAAGVALPNCSGAIVQAPESGIKYVLTNWHCCRDYASGVIKADAGHDLCALGADQTRHALKVSHKKPKYHDVLYTRGYPGLELRESEGQALYYERMYINFASYMEGMTKCPADLTVVRTPDGVIRECSGVYDFLRTTLYSEPGSSGSPVVNSQGELAGVIQTWEGPSNVRSAGVLPLEYVYKFFKGL